MTRKRDKGGFDADALRRKAMERLGDGDASSSDAPLGLGDLGHELEVQRTELEVQNEELRRAQVELIEARDRYRDLYEFAPVAYLTLDASGVVREINLAGVAMCGRTRGDIVERRVEVLFLREDRDACYMYLRDAADGVEHPGVELRLDRPDQAPAWVQLRISSGAGPEASSEFRVAMTDITLRKQAEQALERARQELERRVEERTAELCNTVQTLKEEVERRIEAETALRERSEQLRALAADLTLAEQRERQRMAAVLHDGLQQYLAAARFRLAPLQHSDEPTARETGRDVSALLSDAIETSRSLTAELSPPILQEGDLVPGLEWLARWMKQKHGLAVDVEVTGRARGIRPDLTILVFEAVRELLFNVAKHARVGKASVRVVRQGSSLEVIVADEGAGFDPRRVRARGGRTGGIGLFHISERVDLVGGKLNIESKPGKGARLTLTFPVEPPEEKSAEAAEVAPVSADLLPHPPLPADDKIRTVLVDDHVVVREGLATLLGEEPDIVVVGVASDGESAIRLVRDVRPDVVLMDISMPGMNGIEATRIIHAELPEVRVIGLSMYEKSETGAAMREAGAAGFLSKSGPASELLATIRSAARTSRP